MAFGIPSRLHQASGRDPSWSEMRAASCCLATHIKHEDTASHYGFVFRRVLVQISAKLPSILTDGFLDFPECPRGNRATPSSGKLFFIFGRSGVWIPSMERLFLDCCGFPQYLQTHAGIVAYLVLCRNHFVPYPFQFITY